MRSAVCGSGAEPSCSSSLSDSPGDPPSAVRPISLLQQIVASSTGAICTSLFMTPMDVVKTRLQQQVKPIAKGECFLYHNGLMDHLCTACASPSKNIPCEWYQRPGHFSGTLDAFVKITRQEGIRSLWSGLSPTLVMAIPATVFYFSIYDRLNARLKCKYSNSSQWIAPMLAGAIARTIALTVVSPIEMIRTKMQSEQMSYRDVGKAVRVSLQTYGWRGFYLGWVPTMCRDIPFSAIYWGGYELCKSRLLRYVGREETTFAHSFACGATAGTCAALVTAPFDVVKTQRQIMLGKALSSGQRALPTSTIAVLKELLSTRGVTALWAGCIPRVAKIAPACAIMIGSYEYWKLYFAHRNTQHHTV